MFRWSFIRCKKTTFIYVEIKVGILRISWYELGFKKLSVRCEISYGWDNKKKENLKENIKGLKY